MNVIATTLPGVVIIEPKVFGDARGFFLETWNRPRYEAAGMPGNFIQDNLSSSRRGVLRGLHYQKPFAQGKLLSVVEGEIFDVAVDIRRGSPDFGRWVGVMLSGANRRQLYVPAGFRAWVLRGQRHGTRDVQVHRGLSPRGRPRRALGRPRDRHRLARRGSRRLGEGRPRATTGARSRRTTCRNIT